MDFLDIDKVRFTDHAIRRFEERYRSIYPKDKLNHPERTARKFLARAKEDNTLDSVARVKRLINNGFVEVRYFLSDGWRFVIKEEGTNLIVLTVENKRESFSR